MWKSPTSRHESALINHTGLRQRADVRARRRRRLQVVRGDGHAPLLHDLGRRTRCSGITLGTVFLSHSNTYVMLCVSTILQSNMKFPRSKGIAKPVLRALTITMY